MKVKIKETGEIKDLEYLIQKSETDFPKDLAAEYVYDDENVDQLWGVEDDAEAEMSQETYDWWADLFACMEHCDEMMREMDPEDLETVKLIADPDPNDLETYFRLESALEREIKQKNA